VCYTTISKQKPSPLNEEDWAGFANCKQENRRGIKTSPIIISRMRRLRRAHSSLLGFEVTPGVIPAVVDVPVTIDLCRVGTGRSPFIDEINAVDRQQCHVLGVDERAEVAGLPAERARSIFGKRRRDRGIYRAAGGSTAPTRSGSAGGGSSRSDRSIRPGRIAAATPRDGSREAVDREAVLHWLSLYMDLLLMDRIRTRTRINSVP